MTPQARAIKLLESEGWLVDVVEQINRWRGMVRRKDLFGGFDLLALNERGEVKAIQVTSRSNVSARVAKIAELPAIGWLRRAGWALEVWGYGKTATKGDWLVKDVS